MPKKGEHIERVKAHLQEHGRTQSAELCRALDLPLPVLIAAVRLPLERGEIVKQKAGRIAFYELGDGSAPAEEQGVDAEFAAALWADGDLVIYGAQENVDGSITLNAEQVAQIKRLIAWCPAV